MPFLTLAILYHERTEENAHNMVPVRTCLCYVVSIHMSSQTVRKQHIHIHPPTHNHGCVVLSMSQAMTCAA